MTTIRLAHLALCAAMAPLVAPAQGGNDATAREAPQTVIRAEARLVLVDAVVRDKKGRVVGDLGAKDFRLWEDGKAQPLASFSLEGAGPQDESEAEYLAFLFDGSGVAASSRVAAEGNARQEVAKFAGACASPNRYMAVMNFNGDLSITQNFTALAERVQRAAGDTSHVAGGIAVVPVRNADLSALMSDATAGPEMGTIRDSSRPPPPPWTPGDTAPALISDPLPLLDAIGTVADSMAAIRGRKFLVVASPSRSSVTTAPPAWQTAAAARACNRANVALYATNQALKSVAEETGGRWITNDLIRELGAVVDDQEKRYVLGLTPVESPDGSCHSLRVQTTRGGLDVRARSAYCNVKAPVLLAAKAGGRTLEERAAGPSAGHAAASVELPYFYTSPGIALVDLAMEMDLTNLRFAKQNGKQHAEFNLAGSAYGTDGEVAGRFSETVPLDFDTGQEAEAFRKQPYRRELQFSLRPGRYNLRVAFGSGDQTFGKVEAPLAIDPWDGQHLSLSGIALAGQTRKVPDLASDLDPSLLEGHKDLIAKSNEIVPSGSNRLRRSAPCIGYLEIYDSLLAGPNPPAYDLGIRVLDRRTGEEKEAGTFKAADYIRPGNPVVPVILRFSIASLAPGAYTLEVKAVRSPGNDSVVRTAGFEVLE
jgi:VWFA-related protein